MLDVLIVVLLVGAAVGGYRLGFIARAASWAGLVIGLVVAARLMPRVIESVGGRADRGELLLVAAGLLLGGAVAGQALGILVGVRAQVVVAGPVGRRVDAVGGAAAGMVGLLVVVWLLVPALADMTGWPAREVRRSRVVAMLAERLPSPPDATRTLRRLLGDGYPQVFEGLDRSPDVGPVPEGTGIDQARAEAVAGSVVRVVGEACGRIQEGTGWVARPGLVVTNAHVVAGEPATELETQGGRRVAATLVAFDPEVDLAVLSAPGLDAPALPVAPSEVGQRGAVFGHPGGGPLELSPFEVRRQLRAVGSDIYGRPGVAREVLVLASALAPGDSGSPLVDAEGRVVGVAFAIAPDRPGVAYAVPTIEVEAIVAAAGAPVSAGPCAA